MTMLKSRAIIPDRLCAPEWQALQWAVYRIIPNRKMLELALTISDFAQHKDFQHDQNNCRSDD